MMNTKLVIRLGTLFFFIGLNVVLGAQFLKEAKLRLPAPLEQLLRSRNLLPSQLQIERVSTPEDYAGKLQPRLIAAALNQERARVDLPPLEWNQELATAAARLLSLAEAYDYDFDKFPLRERLPEAVKAAGYEYLWVSQSTLVGPLTINSVIDAWYSPDSVNEALATASASTKSNSGQPPPPEPTQVGFAATVVTHPQFGTAGVVIQLLGTPQAKSKRTTQPQGANTVVSATQPREIPDAEVLAALNNYRATHGHEPLTQDERLCAYAQKRAEDLIAFGGLDAHAGFTADFSGETRPSQLADYPGTQFGENLAYQFCRNMTTGASFIAGTGTELIEWCFDSSTKGHREAQLSTVYKHACVRHGKNSYVVIFGN